MITVIIPALNEEKTIARVVQQSFLSPLVNEVIVVDDKSMDKTVEIARTAGANVITSTKLGKGASMKDGILISRNEIIVFLDADISSYPDNVVELLTKPLLLNTADFVKSCFTRQAGRVTELVAKPLLSILYPSFPVFQQPLSGMIAGRKIFFSGIEFEDGYGVDIGLLIDMYLAGARITEVNIGNIENRMQSLTQLGNMSGEVARTIIKKSKQGLAQNLETYENIQVIREQMEFAIREGLMSLKKIAVFDMDNTLLRGSFIHAAAERFSFKPQLLDIISGNNNAYIRTKQIAKLLRGRSIGELLELTDEIPVTANLQETVQSLKEQGYITGIISDSYDCVTQHLKNKFGFDFSMANELEFSKSIATGEVKVPSFFLPDEMSLCRHDYCKLNALINIARRYEIDLKNTLVVGDGENDLCCIRKAGIGIAFCTSSPVLMAAADYTISEPDMQLLIPLLE